jgi:hypothetical protein
MVGIDMGCCKLLDMVVELFTAMNNAGEILCSEPEQIPSYLLDLHSSSSTTYRKTKPHHGSGSISISILIMMGWI